MTEIRVKLFGTFNVWIDHAPVEKSAWRQRKVQSLLQYFMLHRDQLVTHDQLIDAIFVGLPADKAKRALYSRISELRKLLEPSLEKGSQSAFVKSVHEGYRFVESSSIQTDVDAFVRLVDEAMGYVEEDQYAQALNIFKEALEHYTDDLLIEEIYEEWTISHRDHFKDLYLDTLEHLALCHSHMGEYEEAIACCDRVIEAVPTRERAFRSKMRYEYLTGHQDEALAAYAKCADALREAYAEEPSEATEALYIQIKQGKVVAPKRHIESNIPAEVTSFVGRSHELNEIFELLDDASCRLLTLVGLGGVGKTRLATKIAELEIANQNYLDGIYLVPLEDQASSEYLISRIADEIGFSFISSGDSKEQLIQHLSEKQILLVLDQFENLVSHAAALTDLLEQLPDLRILVTSRQRLNLKSEWIYEVSGLGFPKEVSDETESATEDYESAQLFIHRARQVRARNFSKSELREIGALCQAVEGMPLGLELSAALTREISCGDILDGISKNYALLSTPHQDVPERQRSIQSVFEYSWELLDPTEQALFSKLCVFRGGFTLEAAQEITGASAENLGRFIDLSMLRLSKGNRYQIHELLRQFGEEKLGEERGESQVKHLEFFADFLVSQLPLLEGEKQLIALKSIKSELENIQVAWDWGLVKLSTEILSKMIYPLGVYFNTQSRFRSAFPFFINLQKSLETKIKSNELLQDEHLLYGKSMLWIGNFHFRIGQYSDAERLIKAGLDIVRETDDNEYIARFLVQLIFIEYEANRHESATEHVKEVAAICETLPDCSTKAYSLNHIGAMLLLVGKYREAEKYLLEGLNIARDLQNPTEILFSHMELGILEYYLGRYENALRYWQECLESEVINSYSQSQIFMNLGLAEYMLENTEDALAYYKKSLAISRKHKYDLRIANSLENLVEIEMELGNLKQARIYADEMLVISQQIENQRYYSKAKFELGNLELKEGNTSKSISLFKESIETFERISDRRNLSRALTRLGVALHMQGKQEEALEQMSHSLEISIEIEALAITINTLVEKAKICLAEDDHELGIEILQTVTSHPSAEKKARAEAIDLLSHHGHDYSFEDVSSNGSDKSIEPTKNLRRLAKA